MLDPKQIDDLARRLAASMPKGVQVLQEDLSRGFRATLEAGLNKLDLVTREEFDVQAAVLARTRAKLDALAVRVAELEAAATEPAAPAKPRPTRAKPKAE
jgi:BMFP domain-containing protein YqiC